MSRWVGSIPTRSRQTAGGVVVLLALLTSDAPGRAQETPPQPPDTVVVERTRVTPNTGQEPEGQVSPGGAMLRSVIIPGWGQVAADQPGRGALYFGVWSGMVFMVVKTQARLAAAERAQDSALVASRKRQREDWLLFAGVWALVSGIDAWVSAHFQGFEGELVPPDDGSAGVQFQYPLRF